MPTIQADARFLGLDLSVLGRNVRRVWSDLQDAPPLSWLTPESKVVLLHQDGEASLWWGSVCRIVGTNSTDGPFIAVELPDEWALSRTLVVPDMGDADIASAAALQVRTISPFVEQDLVWGYRTRPGATPGQQYLDIVLASRKQIAQCIQLHAARLGSRTPEVWVNVAAGTPIVLAGYGERLRVARGVRGRWGRYSLVAFVLALMGGIFVTPTLQLRARAIEAVGAYDDAVRRTQSLVGEREALMQSVEKLNVVSELLAGRVEPMKVLDRLTKILPDDTALQGFALKGQKVTITGLTANASALMQILGDQAGVSDVRSPAPTTRVAGANSKENFVIEFSLDLREFGVALAPVVLASAPPSPAAPAASGSAPLAVAPVQPPIANAPPVAPSVPGALVPVFGGSPPPKSSKSSAAKPENKGAP